MTTEQQVTAVFSSRSLEVSTLWYRHRARPQRTPIKKPYVKKGCRRIPRASIIPVKEDR